MDHLMRDAPRGRQCLVRAGGLPGAAQLWSDPGRGERRLGGGLTISLQGPERQAQDIEAVIDTGYSGFLTLPAVLVTELGLPFAYVGRALLANDDEVTFDVHDVTVLWDGQPRHIKADATGSTPLVGMLLLDRHNLNIEVERGGLVAIEVRA